MWPGPFHLQIQYSTICHCIKAFHMLPLSYIGNRKGYAMMFSQFGFKTYIFIHYIVAISQAAILEHLQSNKTNIFFKNQKLILLF